MVRIKKNKVRIAGFMVLIAVSLACFTYINSIPRVTPQASNEVFVEEMLPSSPEVLPDVELIKLLVKKAFEFMSLSSFGPGSR
jgi:hypothetical protein